MTNLEIFYINNGIMVGDKFSNYDFVEFEELSHEDLFMMNVIVYNETSGLLIDSISLSKHNSSELKINKDGWITLAHAVIPSLNFVKSHKVERNKRVVCTDGKYVYIYLNGDFHKLYTNDILDLLNYSDNMLFKVSFEDLMYIENLKQYTLNLLVKSLSSKEYDDECDLSKNYLDVINHLIKKESNEEAQRLVEQFRNCPGMLKNVLQRRGNFSCGCCK